jgi:NADH-quinone oxidoreductase subunit L
MPSSVSLVWLAVLLPLLGFLANGWLSFFRPNAKRAVGVIGVGVLAAAFVVSLAAVLGLAGAAHDAPFIVHIWSWMPVGELQVDLAFQVDQLSAVMLMVVTGVGALIHLFSVGYMRDDASYPRYFAYLNLFVFFMLMLVLGASFPVLFIGWEGVGLCSYLLIGFWFTDEAKATAGKKAFIMNRIGDFGLLMAMFMIFRATGSLDFLEVFEGAPSTFITNGAEITLITMFLFLGCVGKSAQIPLYTWLPDAMAGPTPVSALIHAATMVTAGVYLVARTNVLFAMAPVSSAVVALVGAVTALFAATIALKQWDIKKVLAYSTVSQLGYMFVGVGVGAYTAGIFHLGTHAFFKALLFLGSGSVIHVMHHAYHHTHSGEDPQDMRNMGGLAKAMPWTAAVMWLATLAIAGVPGFSGFFSKDQILAAAFVRGHDAFLFYVVWALGAVAALLTAFYMTRLMLYTFHGPGRTGPEETKHLHEAPWIMTAPLVVLAVGSVFGGMFNLPHVLPGAGWLEHWLEPTTEGSLAFLPEVHLSAALEWTLIGVATVIAAAGILGAWFLLKPDRLTAAKAAPAETGVQRVLLNKYYVDELYNAVVVRPVNWLSTRVLWRIVDVNVIDNAGVNGAGNVSKLFGWVATRFQTGNLSTYVVLFVIGVLFVLSTVVG